MKGAGTAQHSLAAATQRVAPQRYRNGPRGIATVKQCVEWQSKAITYYDKHNRRYKQVDLSGNPHIIGGEPVLPHTHKGYEHNEKGNYTVSPKEQKMIDRVTKTWYNHLNSK